MASTDMSRGSRGIRHMDGRLPVKVWCHIESGLYSHVLNSFSRSDTNSISILLNARVRAIQPSKELEYSLDPVQSSKCVSTLHICVIIFAVAAPEASPVLHATICPLLDLVCRSKSKMGKASEQLEAESLAQNKLRGQSHLSDGALSANLQANVVSEKVSAL